MNKRIIKRGLTFIIVIAVLLLLIPIPMRRQFTMMEYQMDKPDYSQIVHVNLKGWYHINLSSDTFRGTVDIPEYAINNPLAFPIEVQDPRDEIEYWVKDKAADHRTIVSFGQVRTDFLLKHLFHVMVGDNQWMDTELANWYEDHSRLLVPEGVSYSEAKEYVLQQIYSVERRTWRALRLPWDSGYRNSISLGDL